MRPAIQLILICATAMGWANLAMSEPSWTRTGNCQACHVDVRPGLLTVFGHDGFFDPDADGPLPAQKVFNARKGPVVDSLLAQLAGFNNGDRYAVALTRLEKPGVLNSTALSYAADCVWTDWLSNLEHVYTEPTRSYTWGIGPTVAKYDLTVAPNAKNDCYDAILSVAGVEQGTGALVYAEEHFYLSVPPPNWPPSVAITGPADKAVFNVPALITFTADASDADGAIAKVDFFQNGVKLGEVADPPYTYVWSGASAGNYRLTARATDDVGQSTTSLAINITVNPPPRVPGDFDLDGDVDQADFGHLQICMTGPGGSQTNPLCNDAKLDNDTDVDLDDIALFQRCMSGAGVLGDPNCAAP